MNISKINLKGTNYDIKDKLVRDSIGVASSETSLGIAPLDASGKVPSANLPSYVDDVIEGYYSNGVFYNEQALTTQITPETGKIYVDKSTNKTYRYGSSLYVIVSNGDSAITTTINKTWAQLKAMRDNSQLIPGLLYRITDYECTTTQADTQSAGHVFDIIVRADDVNVLNENAHAALHVGDTYFANSKLETWLLRYTIDNINWSLKQEEFITLDYYSNTNVKAVYLGTEDINGTTYYKWTAPMSIGPSNNIYSTSKNAGSTLYYYFMGSRGSISTIKSYVYNDSEGKGTIIWMKDEFNNICFYDFKNIQYKRWIIIDSVVGRNDSISSYYMGHNPLLMREGISYSTTYTWAYTFSSTKIIDTQYDKSLDENGAHDNIINSRNGSLNNIVIYGSPYYNYFGPDCYNSTIGNLCYCNFIMQSFAENIIGDQFLENYIGFCFLLNIIGKIFCNNTIGINFRQNSIALGFMYNTIGNYFYYNKIGLNCKWNRIMEYCRENDIEDNFCYNAMGTNCNHIVVLKLYVYYNIIESGNQYIHISSTATTSSSNFLGNIKIAQGVNNTTTIKTISHSTVNDTFQTVYQPANSQTILI